MAADRPLAAAEMGSSSSGCRPPATRSSERSGSVMSSVRSTTNPSASIQRWFDRAAEAPGTTEVPVGSRMADLGDGESLVPFGDLRWLSTFRIPVSRSSWGMPKWTMQVSGSGRRGRCSTCSWLERRILGSGPHHGHVEVVNRPADGQAGAGQGLGRVVGPGRPVIGGRPLTAQGRLERRPSLYRRAVRPIWMGVPEVRYHERPRIAAGGGSAVG
jgi:hypothetical protein